MDYTHDFKNPDLCRPLLEKLIHLTQGKPLRFMEVCGTHTVSIFQSGLRSLLPENIVHLSGPGCPVCVTHDAEVEAFLQLAGREGVIVATFGDLLRVPGAQGTSLKHAQAAGARVEIVYSPLDAVALAQKNPHDTVVFLGVGFETTAPAIAGTMLMAQKQKVKNFCVFSCHKLVPPALRTLLDDANSEPDASASIDAFLLPGHVSTILGIAPYSFLADYKTPGIIAGFEPADILLALCMMTEARIKSDYSVQNAYKRAVDNAGNPKARAILEEVFVPCDALWRGIGKIANSGLAIGPAFAAMDAVEKLGIELSIHSPPPTPCRCGDVLKGKLQPPQCPLFAKACTPAKPVGPCMVSTEGSCAAYYKYRLDA